MTDQPTDAALDATRMFVYSHVADHGDPPTSAEIASGLEIPVDEARGRLRALAARRTLVLDPSTSEIWMTAPFSAVPTRFRVHGEHASWWANCSWDMFGIPATLGVSVTVNASCACCNELMRIEVDAERGPRTSQGFVHFLVPARQWYDDIGFT